MTGRMRTIRADTRPAEPQGQVTTSNNLFPLLLLAFLSTVVLLGVNFVAVRFSNQELPPFWGAGLRFTIASLILLAVVRLKRLALPRGAALVGAALFGLLVFAAAYGLMYWALLYVSSGMAAVLFATVPLLTLLFAILLRLEQFRWRGLLGAMLVLVGVGLVFQEQLQAAVPLLALLAILLAAVCAALSGIVIKRFPRSHPISTNAVAMAIGAVLLLILSWSTGEAWQAPTLPATWGALAWLIMSAIVAFVLMVWILSHWSASATSYTSVLQPLVTVAVASWLAGEQVTLLFLVGGVLVLVGVYIGALTGQPNKL